MQTSEMTVRRGTQSTARWLRMAVIGGLLLALIVLYRLWSAQSIVKVTLERTSADQSQVELFQQEPEPRKVSVQIFMESQCPDTTAFLQDQLLGAWSELKEHIVLELVPFGKAEWSVRENDYAFECQHGPKECDVNQLMCCGIDQLKRPELYLPYVSCLQGKSLVQAQSCSAQAGLDHQEMLNCANGKKGRMLHLAMGQRTKSLSPKMVFVPWVVIDGKRHSKAHRELKTHICQKIDEDARPSVCNS